MTHIKHRTYTPRPEMTIFNIYDYTPEDVVKEALYRLVNAGRFGFDTERDRCMYFTPDGASCAVGLLIPRDYDLDPMHNAHTDAARLLEEEILTGVECWDYSYGEMLNDLQELHDRAARAWVSIEPPGSEEMIELLQNQTDVATLEALYLEFLGGFYDSRQLDLV